MVSYNEAVLFTTQQEQRNLLDYSAQYVQITHLSLQHLHLMERANQPAEHRAQVTHVYANKKRYVVTRMT